MDVPASDERSVILSRIRGIPGVLRADWLTDEVRRALHRLATPLAAENRGMAEVLAREHSVCLFKGRLFRAPNEPTVVLMDDRGAILGRELVSAEKPSSDGERRMVSLGRDFVLVAGVRPQGPVRFVLPPVRFPELEGLPGIRRPVSASPDPPQDQYLRGRFGVGPDRDVASVLVGYDTVRP